MSTLRGALADYLDVRRAPGSKLDRAEKLLGQFVSYLEFQHADVITVEHALAWATLPQRSGWWHAIRLSAVRRFAVHRHTVDERTQVPPPGLIAHRRHRATPYLNSDTEIHALVQAATALRSRVCAAALRDWRDERHGNPTDPLFPTRRGRPLSRDAIEHRITHYAARATEACPSLRNKAITAHTLRHTTAMRLLHAGVDTSIIALWLGHESVDTTQIYLNADMNLKEKALARIKPPNGRTGRYQPPDSLIAWLEAL
jgi:site-specific recombinase XerD